MPLIFGYIFATLLFFTSHSKTLTPPQYLRYFQTKKNVTKPTKAVTFYKKKSLIMTAKLSQTIENGKQNAEIILNNSLSINELKPFVYENRYSNGRLNCPVCIVKGIAPKIIEKTTLETLVTKKLRSLDPQNIETANKLQTAYQSGDKKAYDALKQSLYGFVIGDFKSRKDADVVTYVPLLCLDIDGYNDHLEASYDLDTLKKNDKIFAVWFSPSGNGLRVLAWTDSTPETHKVTYTALQAEICTFLNLTTDKDKFPHVDVSTSNVSRLWFISETSELYLNIDSVVFSTPSVSQPTAQASATTTDKRPQHTHEPLSDTQKLEACLKIAKNDRHMSDGDTNPFVFCVACIAIEHGILKDTILAYFSSYYAYRNFDKTDFYNKIAKPINSANGRTRQKFTDAQLVQYLKKEDPSVLTPLSGPTKSQKSQPGPDKAVAPKAAKATPSVVATIEPKKTTTYNTDTDNGDDDDFNEERKTPKITLVKRYLTKTKDFRFNDVLMRPEVSPKGKNEFEAVNMADLYCELLETARLNGIREILDNVLKSSFVPKFNPIKDYFENNPYKWDETQPDYIDNLANYVKAKDKFWFNSQYKKALVRTVACGLGVIKFNKHCFTLIGGQNGGKSSYIRFHAETPFLKQYYKENPRIEHKDALFALARNLILNYDELDSANKADIAKLKSYFSIGDFQERKNFDIFDEAYTRIGSFFGSTNRTDFLTDETGNVRWLCMEIDGINFDYKQNVDIDKVWAQAYYLLMNGFAYQMTKDEIAYSEKANSKFLKSTYEMELIREYYEAATEKDHDIFLTASRIVDDLQAGRTTKIIYEKVGKALNMLGFEGARKYDKEKRNTVNGYYLKRVKN